LSADLAWEDEELGECWFFRHGFVH
jgi:hypothetical protein